MTGGDRLITLLIFLVPIFGIVLSDVPVLLWEASATSNSHDETPALYQLDSDEFSNLIVKKTHVHKPLIVVFLEETLSVEDFSWQDVQHRGSFPQLKNLTTMAAKLEFIPSVEDPVNALNALEISHNYLWKKYDRNNLPTKGGILLEVKMKVPLNNEDRPDLLRRHDANIAEIYSQLLAKHSSIIAIFTGKQSSWVELESNRVRRDADESNTNSSNSANSPTTSPPKTVLKGTTSDKVFFLVDPLGNPNITIKNETTVLTENLRNSDCCKTDVRTAYTRLLVTYKNVGGKPLKLRFRFEKQGNSSWVLVNSEVEQGTLKEELIPDVKISASYGYSFKTNKPVVFKSKDGEVMLTMSGLKAQGFADVAEFSVSGEKNVFFTAGIWSGLIVTFILGVILAWGIVMLMDIKTMDRFDDPKGKTIAAVGGD